MMLACMIPFGVRGPVGAARDHGPVRPGARGMVAQHGNPLGELDPVIRLFEGNFIPASAISLRNRGIHLKYLAHAHLSITASQPLLELILSNGRRIAVAPGFDIQTLRRLIAVVEERPCLD